MYLIYVLMSFCCCSIGRVGALGFACVFVACSSIGTVAVRCFVLFISVLVVLDERIVVVVLFLGVGANCFILLDGMMVLVLVGVLVKGVEVRVCCSGDVNVG